MSIPVIEINNLGKQYRLGQVGTSTMSDDLKRWLYRLRGKEDPFLKVGEANDRSKKGNSEFVWALKDINIKINQGEVLGIIGKNGAGKSTLLKILSRTTLPSIGEYKIKGRIASLLEVGTGFHPDLSGRENVFLNGAILGMTKSEIKAQFDAIVDFSGVERYIDTPVKRYSSGMYVRLAFAVAAHLNPEILIVDEVLAVGDQEFQDKCIGKMKDISSQGRTVLFVSHNMAAIKNLCSRVIVLNKGVVGFDGKVQPGVEYYFKKEQSIDAGGLIPRETERYNTGEAYFRKILICGNDKIATSDIFYKSKFHFQLELEVLKKLSNVMVDIKISSRDGIVIMHSLTYFDNFKIRELTEGTHTIEAETENNLLPGGYSVTIGLHSASTGTASIDYLENVIEFNVLSIAEPGVDNYPFDWVYGSVAPKTTWKING